MKTWEMIKELTENPGKKFTYNGGRTYLIMEDGMIVWKGEHQRGQEFAIGYVDKRERDWEEVKTPVTFMEAFEALRDYEKNIYCILNGKKHSYKENVTGSFKFREDCIAERKWYIED